MIAKEQIIWTLASGLHFFSKRFLKHPHGIKNRSLSTNYSFDVLTLKLYGIR